jgi:hypothetical protein
VSIGGSPPSFGLNGDADWKLSVVSGPRNHLYRTAIRLIAQAFRAGREPHHVGDFAHELNREAVLTGGDANAINEAAKDLKRLRFCRGINERVLQAGDLLPIEFCQIGMEPW